MTLLQELRASERVNNPSLCCKNFVHQKESILCVEDNKRTIITTENKCSVTGHMKHVDVKFRFVQESIKMGEIRIRYISTELNWADVLTYRLIVSEKFAKD